MESVDVLIICRFILGLKPEIQQLSYSSLFNNHHGYIQIIEIRHIRDCFSFYLLFHPSSRGYTNSGTMEKILIGKEGRASVTYIKRYYIPGQVTVITTECILRTGLFYNNRINEFIFPSPVTELKREILHATFDLYGWKGSGAQTQNGYTGENNDG